MDTDKDMKNKTKNIIEAAATLLLVAVFFDLLILFVGLGQIALEGRTGYWAPFWRVQAEFVIKLLN